DVVHDAGGGQIVDDLRPLVVGEPRLQRGQGGAELERAEQGDHERRAVADDERDAVTGADTAVMKRPRESPGLLIELTIGQGAAIPAERDLLGMTSRRGFEARDDRISHAAYGR